MHTFNKAFIIPKTDRYESISYDNVEFFVTSKKDEFSKKVKFWLEINKEINSSRVVYEYDNQNKGEFPGSIYEESINEQLNDNPVLKCNLIPILTSEECKINNIPITNNNKLNLYQMNKTKNLKFIILNIAIQIITNCYFLIY